MHAAMFSMWRMLVGSLILWLIILVCTYVPRLPNLSHNRQDWQTMQQKLTELSVTSHKAEDQVRYLIAELKEMRQLAALLGDTNLLIEKLKVRLAEEKTTCNEKLPSMKHELLTRKIENGVNEMEYLVTSYLKKLSQARKTEPYKKDIKGTLEVMLEQHTSLLRDIHDLKTASGPAGWHEQEAKELSAIVQRRLHYLQTDEKVLSIETASIISRLSFMPLAIPEDLAPRLLRLHGQPFVWWVGQLLMYLMRPQPYLQDDLIVTEKWLGFKSPIVGVHIRRSDKIGQEAEYHSVNEYMSHVELYYKHLRKHGPVDKKRIYLATDNEFVLGNITRRYPEYEVISDKTFAKTAADFGSRFSGPSLRSIIMDTHFLSKTDYLVCTFSSQVGRLAYELMQTRHPDASNSFHSLDDIYYFGLQNKHYQEALLDHSPQRPAEIELKKGDMIEVVGNQWDGYSTGKNRRTGKSGLFPSFKVKDHIVISEFPVFSQLSDQQHQLAPWQGAQAYVQTLHNVL